MRSAPNTLAGCFLPTGSRYVPSTRPFAQTRDVEASRPISSPISSRLAADESRVDREDEGGGNFAGFASDRREVGFFPAPRTRNGGAGHEQEPEEQGEDGVAPHGGVRVTRACARVLENVDPRPRARVFFSGRTRVLSTLIGGAGVMARRTPRFRECRVVVSRAHEERFFEAPRRAPGRSKPRTPFTRERRSSPPPPPPPPTRADGAGQRRCLAVARRLAPGARRTR